LPGPLAFGILVDRPVEVGTLAEARRAHFADLLVAVDVLPLDTVIYVRWQWFVRQPSPWSSIT